MRAVKPFVGEVKSRGQLTIPKKIREMNNLEEGQTVSIIPIGESILITPRRLVLDEARRQIGRILKESGLSLEDLLAGLQDERKILFKERYGRKSR